MQLYCGVFSSITPLDSTATDALDCLYVEISNIGAVVGHHLDEACRERHEGLGQ